LFIDGVERLYHANELQKLALILKIIEPAAVAWKVVLTCPSDQLDKIKHLLSNYNLSAFAFTNLELPPLSVNELVCSSIFKIFLPGYKSSNRIFTFAQINNEMAK
jgi:hypothetical protein